MVIGERRLCAALTEIEVGATADNDLRYWRAKEAVRHGELRLVAQASTRQSFEARATTLLGWVLAAGAALAIWLATAMPPASQQALAAMMIFVMLFATALCCVLIVWPQFWGQPGYNPRRVIGREFETELEQLEAMADGYATAIEGNERYLSRAGRLMRLGFCITALTPFLGGAVWS